MDNGEMDKGISFFHGKNVAIWTLDFDKPLYGRLLEIGGNFLLIERNDGSKKKLSVSTGRVRQVMEHQGDTR